MNGPQALHRPDSAEVTIRRTETPDNGSRAVAHADRPRSLQGVVIPSRNRTIRRRVVDRYRECPWLAAQDVGAVTTREHLFQHVRNLGEIMSRLGGDGAYLKVDGEPRKIIDKYAGLVARLLTYDQALGLTPGSRLNLGIDTARLRKAAEDGDETEPDVEIEEMEARIVARIANQHPAAQEPESGPSGSQPTSGTIESMGEGA